jgi:hypothetical protein
MKNILFKSFLVLALAVACFSCKKDDELSELVRDNRPAVPVTFPGATTFGFNPYITTPAEGSITFTLSIPASSGRTIREITKVGSGGTGINAATLKDASYISAPIPGNGTTAVFTTDMKEFKIKRASVYNSLLPKQQPLPEFWEIAFIFLITLDDGTQIVTQQVRVRVLT